jgi:hypothetical protein
LRIKVKIPVLIIVSLTSLVFLLPISGTNAEEAELARVLSYRSYIDHAKYEEYRGLEKTGKTYEGDFLHILGEIQNVIAENINVGNISPTFYDEKGAVIEANLVHTSLEPVHRLAPGQKTPFRLVVIDSYASSRIVNCDFSFSAGVSTSDEPFYLKDWIITTNSSYVSSWYRLVVGEIENIGTRNLKFARIFATFYDEDGTVSSVSSFYPDFEGIEILVPGQKMPFLFHCGTATKDYSFCASCSATRAVPYREFKVEAHKSEITDSGLYKITGEVKNVGEINATLVKVIATFYDSNGRILDCDYLSIDESYPHDLKSGQTKPFELLLENQELSSKVNSYTLQLECYGERIPEFELSNFEINPKKAKPGEEIEITCDITNIGEVPATETVELRVKGEVESTKDVTLNVGETRSLTFTLTKEETDKYNVQVYVPYTSIGGKFEISSSPCIIATATYGSELAPEVQFLRDFREDIVYSTFAGSQFMTLFNKFYYSWSPAVANQIAVNDGLKAAGKAAIYPLLGILDVSVSTYTLFGFNHEVGIVMAGFVASSLIGVVYFSPFTIIGLYVAKRFRKAKHFPKVSNLRLILIPWASVVSMMVWAEIFASPLLMLVASGAFVVFTIALTAGTVALTTVNYLTKEET